MKPRFQHLALLAVALVVSSWVGGVAHPTPVVADLKCGDAPAPVGPDTLVVTWSGPAPKDARVRYADATVFDAAQEVLGPNTPADYPEQYTKDVEQADTFNAAMFWDMDAYVAWQKHYGIAMEPEPSAIVEQYLEQGFSIYGTLVQHPMVPNRLDFRSCSVVLQYGVIVWDPVPKLERLFLRSSFYSATDAGEAVNFAPSGGVEMTFNTDNIWFPLELSRVILEPASYVVLDILTPEGLNAEQVPQGFEVGKTGQVEFEGQTYAATRITTVLQRGQEAPDLQLAPS